MHVMIATSNFYGDCKSGYRLSCTLVVVGGPKTSRISRNFLCFLPDWVCLIYTYVVIWVGYLEREKKINSEVNAAEIKNLKGSSKGKQNFIGQLKCERSNTLIMYTSAIVSSE